MRLETFVPWTLVKRGVKREIVTPLSPNLAASVRARLLNVAKLVTSVDSALARVKRGLPKDFPAHIWESISTGMRSEAKRFLRESGLL